MGPQDFLTTLFDGANGAVRICALRNRKSALPRGEVARAFGIEAAGGFIAGYDRPENECGVYFCTATLKPGAKQRNAKNCLQFTCLFGDVDDKNHLLFAHRLIASDAVHDAPRIMRLPGSHNSKEGDWLEVAAVRWNPERRYTLDQLEAWLSVEQVIIPAKEETKEEAKPKSNGHDRRADAPSYSAADIEAVRDALRHIPADNRDTWRDIGMALHAEFGDEGRALWDEWSQSCKDKYDEADQEHTWSHFNSNRDSAIGIGTLFHHAEANGWIRKATANPAADEFEAAVEPLPELVIHDSNPTATARELAVLIAERDDFLFNGNMPVRIAVEAGNMPRGIEVTTEAVRVYAHKICRPIRLKEVKGEIKKIPSALTTDIALLYLKGLEGEWGLRSFRGITTAPILSSDGSIRVAQGYDQATGLWCHNVPELNIPERPTEQDVRSALALLRHTFRTFPFTDGVRSFDQALGVEIITPNSSPGLDESCFLCGLVTAACRPSLPLAPGLLCNAPEISGSRVGKGKLMRAVSIVGSGASPEAFTAGHDNQELDKRLTAALIESQPVVFLDNVNGRILKSEVLASALTENPSKIRVLGRSENVKINNHCLIAVTGNGIDVAEDMTGRLIIFGLDARMENPGARPFAAGFLEDVFVKRAQLLSACLTIWRYGRQNKLRRGVPLGSYEEWGECCRDPLLALGCQDPAQRGDEIRAKDPVRKQILEVYDTWWQHHQNLLLRQADLAPEVLEVIDQKATRKIDGALQCSRQYVSRWLTSHTGTRLGGYVLEEQRDSRLSRAVLRYRLTKEENE